ncbi:MAG: hypothetical protein J0L64_04015 [Acidobacteria bacterium]|nr:hypothetical protein [Acidobacteriota bacterium]
MNRMLPALLLALSLAAQTQKPPRRAVNGNIVTSTQDPAVRLELPRQARYLGVDRWDLYGVADCALHVWVEADERKVIQRLYWIQFEEFLPTKPESRYRYPFTKTTRMGGLEFDVRARFGATGGPTKPDSDGGHVEAMVKAAGYQFPAGTMNVRLVHLPDAEKRKELMIIYIESLDAMGLAAADLEPGGKAAARWPELERGLIERAAERLKFTPLPD